MPLAKTVTPGLTPLEAWHIQKAVTRLQALPAFYPAVQKALRLLEDPDATNPHIEQVILSDQAMAARVLKLANSAYFGQYQRVATVSLALALIGREKIVTLLLRFLGEEMLTMMEGRKPAAAPLRRMSIATAAAAQILAERTLRSDKEELVLAGLLHNIGELVLLSQFRAWYEESLRLASQIPQPEAERAIFGVESRLVGKWLLEAWNFPPFFASLVEHHADPWAVSFAAAPLSAIAQIHAARLVAAARLENRTPEQFAQSLEPRLLSTLEIDADFLTDVYLQLAGQMARLQGALA